MNKAIIAAVTPTSMQLKKGRRYCFCTCGRSSRQPLCDGSHSDTDLKPLYYTAEKDGEAWLCNCKQSQNFPFCDGSHQQFTTKNIGHSI